MVFAFLTLAWSLTAGQPAIDSVFRDTVLPVSFSGSTGNRPGGLEMTFSAVMQVDEPAKAAENLVARTEAMGGYFSKRSMFDIEFRLPMAQADKWMDSLPLEGLVVDKSLETASLEGRWVEEASRLKAKQASLRDYYAVLKVSGDSTIFTIQNAITALQREIGTSLQDLKKLEDRMQYARLTVSFRFRDRTAPLATGQSDFKWLNRLNLTDLLERFGYAE